MAAFSEGINVRMFHKKKIVGSNKLQILPAHFALNLDYILK